MPNKVFLRLSFRALWLVSAVAMAGCSSQQLYSSGQAWQRDKCNKINDSIERNKCLESARVSFEKYQRESEASKSQKQPQ